MKTVFLIFIVLAVIGHIISRIRALFDKEYEKRENLRESLKEEYKRIRGSSKFYTRYYDVEAERYADGMLESLEKNKKQERKDT